jgi:hypothetical protein
MRKFTPGRWKVEEGTTVIWSTNCFDPGTNSVGCIVARGAQPVTWKASRPTADEQDANCRLIAAAPCMYAELETAAGVLEDIAARLTGWGAAEAAASIREVLSRVDAAPVLQST